MTEVWRLEIMDSHGIRTYVYGNETVLRTFIEEWRGCTLKEIILSVCGICESIDRAPMEFHIIADEISSIGLSKIWTY
jgi:hypothetical protein